MKVLPFYNPELSYADVLRIVTTFSAKEKLKKALLEQLNVPGIVLLKSARQGIEAILEILGLTEGDEVIVPSFICAVVPEAIVKSGATPVFCDIEAHTLAIPLSSFKGLITHRTKAVIIPHYFGIPTELNPFLDISKEHGITVIEDCAHAFGALYRGKAVGTFGDFGVFSFGMSKSFRGIGGGFVIAKDRRHIELLSSLIKNMRTLPLLHHIREYAEIIFAPLIFSRFWYPLVRQMIEIYAPMHRKATSIVQYERSITKLEAATALLQLSRFKDGARKRMANMRLISLSLRLPPVSPNIVPMCAYAFVYVERGAYKKLSRHNFPVRYSDFGNLHVLPEFSKFRFENTNEQSLQGRYLLMPLWMNGKEIEQIVADANKLLK